MIKEKAVIHSLRGNFDWVQIIKKLDDLHYIACYNGRLYKSSWNPITGHYYVDDKYGEISMF